MWGGCCGGVMGALSLHTTASCLSWVQCVQLPGAERCCSPHDSSQVPDEHLKGWGQLWGRIKIRLQ